MNTQAAMAVPTSHAVTPQAFGAKADGATDDTDAIQQAINTVFERGGGTVFFPRGVYKLGKPPVIRDIRGNNPNSQIYIPTRDATEVEAGSVVNPDEHNQRGGISFVGECVPLSTVGAYAVHSPDAAWASMVRCTPPAFAGSVLHSTYTHADPDDTAASILGWSVPRDSPWGFSRGQTELRNLTFRAHVKGTSRYPTLSGINAQNARSVVMANVNVDVDQPLPTLVAPPCEVAGFIFPKVNCEMSYFTYLGAYGFKYGFIFGEHCNGDGLHAYVCTHAFSFSGGAHMIALGLLCAQNCRHQVSAFAKPVLGHPPGFSYVKIGVVNIERNPGQVPLDFNYVNFINDPGDHLHGSLTYHIVTSNVGADNKRFIQLGGKRLRCEPSYTGDA